jgi:hypothetical protein
LKPDAVGRVYTDFVVGWAVSRTRDVVISRHGDKRS